MVNRIAFFRKKIIIISFICKALIIIASLIFYVLNFLEDQFTTLIYLIAPVSALYFTVFLKFMLQNKYQRRGRILTARRSTFGMLTLLCLSLSEFTLISWKSYDTTILGSDEAFYHWITMLETGLAIFAGLYLLDLFKDTETA